MELDPPFEVDIEAVSIGGKGHGEVRSVRINVVMNASLEHVISGPIFEEFLVGHPAATEEIRFHVPNFPNYLGTAIEARVDGGGTAKWRGRHHIDSASWSIDLDAVNNSADWWGALSGEGGFGITHMCRVRRSDQKAVRDQDFEKIFWVLTALLSVMRSERTGPILAMGVHEGNIVWERWWTPRIAPWFGLRSWMPHTLLVVRTEVNEMDLTKVVECLEEVFGDPGEKRAWERAIDWYTQSVQAEVSATGIVLAQAGLELAAWMRLVGDGVIPGDSFEKFNAADGLRIALELADVDLEVPASLTELQASAEQGRAGVELDGPGAVVEMRNGTIHPKERQRLTGPIEVIQGRLLAIRYLELLLLRRLAFSGQIRDRTNNFRPEAAPWDPEGVDGTST